MRTKIYEESDYNVMLKTLEELTQGYDSEGNKVAAYFDVHELMDNFGITMEEAIDIAENNGYNVFRLPGGDNLVNQVVIAHGDLSYGDIVKEEESEISDSFESEEDNMQKQEDLREDENIDDYDRIVKVELDNLNKWLDDYGFEVELVNDYNFGRKKSVGMFLNSIQDNASVFPIALNKKILVDFAKEESYDEYSFKEELMYGIRSTLWHEAGHGIYGYLEDFYELDEDEEDVVEEFARYQEDSYLFDVLQDYMKQDESLTEDSDKRVNDEYTTLKNEWKNVMTKKEASDWLARVKKANLTGDQTDRLMKCYNAEKELLKEEVDDSIIGKKVNFRGEECTIKDVIEEDDDALLILSNGKQLLASICVARGTLTSDDASVNAFLDKFKEEEEPEVEPEKEPEKAVDSKDAVIQQALNDAREDWEESKESSPMFKMVKQARKSGRYDKIPTAYPELYADTYYKEFDRLKNSVESKLAKNYAGIIERTYPGEVDELIFWLRKAITNIHVTSGDATMAITQERVDFFNNRDGTNATISRQNNKIFSSWIADLTQKEDILEDMPIEVLDWKIDKNNGKAFDEDELGLVYNKNNNELGSNAVVLDLLYEYDFKLGKQKANEELEEGLNNDVRLEFGDLEVELDTEDGLRTKTFHNVSYIADRYDVLEALERITDLDIEDIDERLDYYVEKYYDDLLTVFYDDAVKAQAKDYEENPDMYESCSEDGKPLNEKLNGWSTEFVNEEDVEEGDEYKITKGDVLTHYHLDRGRKPDKVEKDKYKVYFRRYKQLSNGGNYLDRNNWYEYGTGGYYFDSLEKARAKVVEYGKELKEESLEEGVVGVHGINDTIANKELLKILPLDLRAKEVHLELGNQNCIFTPLSIKQAVEILKNNGWVRPRDISSLRKQEYDVGDKYRYSVYTNDPYSTTDILSEPNLSEVPKYWFDIVLGQDDLAFNRKTNKPATNITILGWGENKKQESLGEDVEKEVVGYVVKKCDKDSGDTVDYLATFKSRGDCLKEVDRLNSENKDASIYYAIDDVDKTSELAKELEEDIEKHDTLNPKLFNNEELKPEIKEKIEQIAYQFVNELNEDGIRFTLKDIVLLGSNVSYNYTKDSDLDIHLIADSSGLECPADLYPLLYSAYRSMFNKNYDIRIKGIPAEIYVEMDEPVAKSNGIYSLNNGWLKKPEQRDIPDLDEEAFDKLFNEWEDKYFELMEKDATSEDIENFIEDLYDLRKESIATEGEYGLGNLVFKEFRNLGYLDGLKELRKEKKGKELSLEQLDEEITEDDKSIPDALLKIAKDNDAEVTSRGEQYDRLAYMFKVKGEDGYPGVGGGKTYNKIIKKLKKLPNFVTFYWSGKSGIKAVFFKDDNLDEDFSKDVCEKIYNATLSNNGGTFDKSTGDDLTGKDVLKNAYSVEFKSKDWNKRISDIDKDEFIKALNELQSSEESAIADSMGTWSSTEGKAQASCGLNKIFKNRPEAEKFALEHSQVAVGSFDAKGKYKKTIYKKDFSINKK